MSTMNHSGTQMDHLGCAENEIDMDGKCLKVDMEKSNMKLFDQDVETFVVWTNIAQGELQWFMAEPRAEWDYPAVVMIHEWWGLNENIKYMAKLLAKQGYRVLAIDLYSGQVAADSDTAKKLSGAVRENPDKAVEKMKLAVDYLKQKSKKVASLGWCFGGQQSLNISLAEKLDATVIYYGHLTDDTEKLSKLQGPVLGIFWWKDQSITQESVKAFETSLKKLWKQNSIYIYPEVGHAFANPTGANYSATETLDAWEKTLKFLEEKL